MQFSQLKKHLITRQFLPAYIVVGEDSFLVTNALKHFKNAVLEFADLNTVIFSDKVEAVALVESLQTIPMLSDIRLTICYDIIGDTAALEHYLQNPNPQAMLVAVAAKLPENLSKLLHKFTVVDCTKLEEEHLRRWVQTELSASSATITNGAFNLLYNYCQGNMQRISVEAAKLGQYRLGGTIDETHVRQLVEPAIEYKVFELSEAVANKIPQKTATLLDGLLAEKFAPIMLIGMLYNHFRRLLYCKIDPQNPSLAKDLGAKDFAITKAKQAAARFSAKQLKQVCDDFHTLDLKSKNGGIEPTLALKRYILNIFG